MGDLTAGCSNSTGHLSTIGYGTSTGISAGRMHHSLSTPAGVDGGSGGISRTPPTTPKKGGKMLAVRVQMLDDTITMFQVQAKALGKVLFEQVCRQLHLLEADYFGLEYQQPIGTKFWLDLEKPMCRQVGLTLIDPLLRFCVKFYTPDPARLEEEFTRYLFCLQVKRDLAQGSTQCNENTAALMASYIVQAECGDFSAEDYPDHTYLSLYKFFPQQDANLERRIMENHKKHVGQSPAEADMNLLETARRCELYGIKMHSAKDHEGVPLNLAVAHLGIIVFQHLTKINTFNWAIIRKISFKRKKFLIKLHAEGYGYYKDVVEFFFDGRNQCKNFWKKCVENHGFFRLPSVKRAPRHRTRVLSRGSSFRYSGKTQKQIVEFVRDNYVKRQTFQRSQSFRASRSLRSSRANVSSAGQINTSISAHPLLPLPPGSDAISVEWDKQPQYLEAALTLSGYTPSEARRRAERALHPSAADSRVPSVTTMMTTETITNPDDMVPDTTSIGERDKGKGIVTHAEVNHQHTADSPPRHRMMTPPCASPESTWSQYSSTVATAGHTPRHHAQADTGSTDISEVTKDNNETVTSGSFYLFPTNTPNNIATSTPVRNKENGNNVIVKEQENGDIGHDLIQADEIDSHDVVNGNRNSTGTKCVGDSNYSIDILSGGESDAADTLGRNRRDANGNSTLDSVTSGRISPLSPNANEQAGDSQPSRRTARRWPTDRSYYIAKELLMTERTYRKDLEVVTVFWSQFISEEIGNSLSKDEAEALGRPCLALEPIAERQAELLAALEVRMAAWEGRSLNTENNNPETDTTTGTISVPRRISDILHEHTKRSLAAYRSYAGIAGALVGRMEAARRRREKNPATTPWAYATLETSTRCPLPLAVYLFRPLHAVLRYEDVLERLGQLYSTEDNLPGKCEVEDALSRMKTHAAYIKHQLRHAENHALLCQLQREISGYDNLLVPDREFVRHGCLFKQSTKGPQQRMFILFSDVLIYGSKSSTDQQRFKIHGAMSVSTVRLETSELPNSFTMNCANRSSPMTVSANTAEERDNWYADIQQTSTKASSLSRGTNSSALAESCEELSEPLPNSGATCGNSLIHVCWHRGTSLGRDRLHIAMRTQLSGYLLRKFKNSHGWQKLWVVFATFSLYFYKSWQDDAPLASLPVLGYSLTTPSEKDGINKDYVFKLVFKHHVYFFRAESESTYKRWIDVIRTAMTKN